MLSAAIDFCFPGSCAACHLECDASAPLCAKCLTQLDALATSPSCRLCAMPLAYPAAPCPHCRAEGPQSFSRLIALGKFDDPMRSMIHAIKYHGAWPLAEYLADALSHREKTRELLEEAQVIVPVPLHPLRQLSRGFNQAEVIAARFARHRGIPLRRPLVRLKATETQTHLHSRASREANLKDAFTLDRDTAIRGRHVVLVDDVMTTGATLRAAARELRQAGPATLCAVVIAIADPRGRQFQRV